MAKECENLHVSYDEFHENIGSSLLALQKCSALVDVSLACQDGQVPAHRVILAASSQFFQSVLNDVSSKDLVIYLKGVKVKYLNYLIEFIYNGNVDVPPNDLHKFLELGQELKVKGLAKKNNKLKHQKEVLNNLKSESQELPVVLKDIEVANTIPEDPFDPMQDDSMYYEDYNINSYTNLYHVDPQLGDVATVRERLLDPSSTLTFTQDKLDQSRFLSHLLSIMQKTNLKGPKGFQWSCLVCGKVYPQRNHLQEHVESKHVKGVIHTCSLCSQEFTQSKHLKFHVKTFHENMNSSNQNIWQYAGEDNKYAENTDNDSSDGIKQEEPPCKMARMQEQDHIKFKTTTI